MGKFVPKFLDHILGLYANVQYHSSRAECSTATGHLRHGSIRDVSFFPVPSVVRCDPIRKGFDGRLTVISRAIAFWRACRLTNVSTLPLTCGESSWTSNRFCTNTRSRL